MVEVKILEGDTKKVESLEISIEQIVEAFLEVDGIHSHATDVSFSVKKGEEIKKLSGGWGAEFNVFDHDIKIKDCATGTRDWKSFAVFVIA